jgi:hypothetical protein
MLLLSCFGTLAEVLEADDVGEAAGLARGLSKGMDGAGDSISKAAGRAVPRVARTESFLARSRVRK